jgi:starch-binding outer membrane protein, SusD/RagB family
MVIPAVTIIPYQKNGPLASTLAFNPPAHSKPVIMKRCSYTIFLAITLCCSCSKFLEKEPLSAATDENFWKNEGEGNSAVAGGYALLRQALFDGYAFWAYGDMPTDQFRTDIGGEDLANISNLRWNTAVPFTNVWRPMMKLRRFDNFYRVIDQANRCIRYLPDIPVTKFSSPATAAADRNALIGEAYFLRAFAYFYMGRAWGGVPIVDESMAHTMNLAQLPRSTPEQVMEKARADVKVAIQHLQWTYKTSAHRAVRANKGAAFALLAHLEAWTGNYTACAQATDSVISKGGYQLVPMGNYLSIWKGQSTEGIFEIAASAETEGQNAAANSIALLTLRTPYLATNTGDLVILRIDEAAFRQKFPDDTDQRIQQAFAFYSSTDPVCLKYANIKYLGENQTIPVAHNNIVVFRLSDMILLRAEALAATNHYGEARTLLNTIRNKAKPGNNYTGPDTQLFQEIITERARELFLEGHRFYDLVRLGRAQHIVDFGQGRISPADFAAGKYYWPVDPYLLTQNNNLLQTPFWSDKM